MAKAQLGTKRICPNCGAKYYDLNRNPIICPRCGTRFEAITAKAARAQAASKAVIAAEEEIEVEAPEEAVIVSLEEADEEVADGGVVKIEGDEDEEEAIEPEEADDTFLEPEDEEGDDVADIIGGVDDEEP